MKRLHTVVLVLTLVSAGRANAQQVGVLGADATGAAVAALEWFSEHADHLRSEGGTMVIALLTSGQQTSAPGAPVFSLSRAPRRSVDILPTILNRIRARSGLTVQTCDNWDMEAPCGVTAPWVWVQVSTPVIDGNEASLALEARQPDRGVRSLEVYAFVLERRRGSWDVVSAEVVGVH